MTREILGWSTSSRFQVLSSDQRDAIHEASLRVLTETGYHIPVEKARQILHDAGARIEGERVYIPSDLIDQALEMVKPVRLFDRNGQMTLPLWEGEVTFGALSDTFYVMDPYQRTVRPYVHGDQGWFTALLDALPHIDWVQCVGQSHDVPASLQTQMAFTQCVRNTTKPILIYAYDRQGLLDILEVVHAIAGGAESFRSHPFLFCASVPAAPLSGTEYNLELLLTCAEHEVPLLYYSCPAIGGNSPASLIGPLVLGNADWLAALALHQLVNPGAPICNYGFTVQLMDMRTTLWAYCAPESQLAYGAVADLAHGYGFPAFGLEIQGDTPRIDAQLGLELGATALFALSSNVELVHNVGNMGAGKLVYPEAPVLADEIIGYCRAAMQPLAVKESELSESIGLIDELGPLGEYVTHEHTLQHFRDFWYPTLFDRSNFDPRAEIQSAHLADRLNAHVRQLIETHEPARLSKEVLQEIEALESIWFQRAERKGEM